ncbi:uncharacterized protein EDB93DRAFT_203617 [Suillus bovinus]|uniref:uncharacterized protein n=1 Tax=Suillus bovinus TaxID=48563 RepID=UPI001B862DCC|nr:uncharacterized protein EDB93DRAFT_203617 [Suillus bovinus]KAG2127547.1 hypothetical protein EDB93DRAFT_203617 [Suillus bovinus]
MALWLYGGPGLFKDGQTRVVRPVNISAVQGGSTADAEMSAWPTITIGLSEDNVHSTGSPVPGANSHEAFPPCLFHVRVKIKNVGGCAEKFLLPPFLLPPMSTARIMHNTAPRSSPAAINTDLLTSENLIDANPVIEEPAMSIEVDINENISGALRLEQEQVRDEIEPSNASEQHVASIEGGLARTMSSTLEQTPDNEKEPNKTKENPAVSIEGSLAKM